MDFYELLGSFDQIGGFDLLLPFLLVFTLIFAVLQKISLFGENKHNIDMIIALVMSIFFLNNTYLIFILQRFLPSVSIILVVVLMFLLILGVFGGKTQFKEGMLGWAIIFSVVAIMFALFSDLFMPGGMYPGHGVGGFLEGLFGPGNTAMVWALLFIVIFMMWIKPRQDPNKGFGHYIEELGKKIK